MAALPASLSLVAGETAQPPPPSCTLRSEPFYSGDEAALASVGVRIIHLGSRRHGHNQEPILNKSGEWPS